MSQYINAEITAVFVAFLVLLLAGTVALFVAEANRMTRLRLSIPGCCSYCHGGGMSGDECTSGFCWDCQATGHPHLGLCTWDRVAVAA